MTEEPEVPGGTKKPEWWQLECEVVISNLTDEEAVVNLEEEFDGQNAVLLTPKSFSQQVNARKVTKRLTLAPGKSETVSFQLKKLVA